jgi:hypothetical protein
MRRDVIFVPLPEAYQAKTDVPAGTDWNQRRL